MVFIDVKYLLIQIFEKDIHHFVTIFIFCVVFNGEDDWIVVGMVLAEFTDLGDGLLEINRLAEGFIIKSMSNDGSFSIIMHVNLHALQSTLQIL